MTEGAPRRPSRATSDLSSDVPPVRALKIPVDLDDLLAEDLDPLVVIAGLAFVADEVQEDIARLVRQCRSSGKTWTQIGQALGVSKQAAWERYSSED
jgi:hypothetical protein